MTGTAAVRRLERDLGELLARHEKARDLGEFSRWARDPVGFVREALGETDPGPWSAQVEIAEAVRDHPLVVVRSCNSAGKDWIAARLALWWVYARRGLVLITGPTERQVREVVMGEVTRAFRRAHDLPGELYRTALRLGDAEHAGILVFTSTEASRLTGFHGPHVLGVLTEAQGVEDFAWEGLLACATGEEDRIVALGNPLAPTGRFYTASGSDTWHSIRISAEDHPNVREGRTVIPGGISRAFVERMASEFGEGSGIYRARVQGEFPEQGESGLFSRRWIEEAVQRWKDGTLRDEARHADPVIAVDPARYGPDDTVVVVRRGPVLEEIAEWGRTGTMESVGKIRAILEKWNVTAANGRRSGRGDVIVDSVGLGAGILDRLDELGFEPDGFNAGRRARDRDRFANLRAESFWHLRERLEAGELALPPDEALAEELLPVEWKPTSDGKVSLPAKDEIRGRLGRSPDKADAVAMAFTGRTGWRELLI